MDFAGNIKEWVALDNRIKVLQDEVKSKRANRNALSQQILEHVDSSNMQHTIIQITDGKLKFQNTKITSPLTYGFLETCLNECINDENQVKQIVTYIKSKRQVRYTQDIKRSYN
jgi:hypothetical protein